MVTLHGYLAEGMWDSSFSLWLVFRARQLAFFLSQFVRVFKPCTMDGFDHGRGVKLVLSVGKQFFL